jgi:hypothetical protein
MSTLPVFIPAKRRAHRKPRMATPPPALTLVSASFSTDPGPFVSLVFDRDIEIAENHPEVFAVSDGVAGTKYIGNPEGGGRTGSSFGLNMDVDGEASGESVLLTVGAGNGIVAADDGAAWSGVTGLELPYPPPPAALVLQSATFNSTEPSVTLAFDRAIDIAAIHMSAFRLADGPDEQFYNGIGDASLVSPTTVKVMLESIGSSSGADVLLTVLANNGIVAVDDGGHWLGVVNRALPFP